MGKLAMQWTGDADSQMFIGRDSFGHVTVAGSWPKGDNDEWIEWKALKPSDLLVLSLMSCSSYDMVMILKRQRQTMTALHITAEATQASEAPYQFTHIHLHYDVAGDGLDPARVERAITLSEEKYCSVAATLRGNVEITHSYEIK